MSEGSKFGHLKPGDRVTRLLGEAVQMRMVVTHVTKDRIVCDADDGKGGIFKGGWRFDMGSGAEEDAALGWGVEYGVTGSRLILDEVKQ